MKKLILLPLIVFLSLVQTVCAQTTVYSENNKFGLMDDDEVVVEAQYDKLIRLRDSYLTYKKGRYGIMNSKGEFLVEPKFTKAERYFGKFAKLGSRGTYALYDDTGDLIIDKEYTSIQTLFGRMFLVEKNYKYGLISFDGDIILAPVADDIYMPQKNILKICYDNVWYSIEQKSQGTMELPDDILWVDNSKFTITQIIEQPIASTSYGIVSAGDYFIKIFSSISPAYEQTIDELVLSHGADTASILMKSSWLAKFPFVYSKNYFNTLKAPNNGPFSNVKADLRHKINNG